MLTLIRDLLDRYQSYHEREPIMHWYAGLLGTVCFPLFYLLRFTKAEPVYDDLWLRLAAAGMCALLLLRRYWPERARPYFYGYSYFALIFTLPFMFVFTSLKNGGGTVAVGNTLMAAFFVILMTDWRNMISMLTLGFGAAAIAFWASDPGATVPANYIARLPILALVVVGGTFFKLALERATANKVREAYAAIAGSIAHEMRHPLGQVHHSMQEVQKLLPAPGAWTTQPLAPSDLDKLYRHLAQGEQAIDRGLQVISMTLAQVNDERPLDNASFCPCSAAEVVRKAVEDYGYEDASLRDRIDVIVLEDFQFKGEETAYLYVLFNLLKNALYLVPSAPAMRITITVGGHAVKVRDTGPGIAAARLKSLFEPFRSIGKEGGTGLGLRYCRRVMRGFGGDITCDSRLGEFTEFTMRFPVIPLAQQEAYAAQVLASARQALSGRRLLLVDDDAAQRSATRQKLRMLEVSIDEAGDGQRTLEMLALTRYDLVLLDLRMPIVDGWQLAGRIRRGDVPLNTDARLVVYSSEPEQTARVKARRVGIDAFVAKPGSEVALARALAGAITKPAGVSQRLLEGRRILVADDSASNRRAVVAFLGEAGAQVVEVDHGQAVLQQLMAGVEIDAVLLDINMPGKGGLQTVQEIRSATAAWSRVPAVALTAHSDAQMLDAARKAGMDGFLVKPVTADVLTATISRLLLSGARQAFEGSEPAKAPEPLTEPLLDYRRLEGYGRLDLLDDLLTEYVPEIQRLMASLEEVARQDDPRRLEDLLHSLLGLSGEAGAQALHQAVRKIYVPMREEGACKAADEWLPTLKKLAHDTEKQLRAYAQQHTVPPQV